MSKPRITKGVASQYAGKDEVIYDLTSSAGGGLISARSSNDGTTVSVDLYRLDPNVTVRASWDDGRKLVASPFDFVTEDGDGVTWTPWTDGYSVGFKAQHEDGRVRFVLLNPSNGSLDGTPTVFLYEAEEDPAAVDGDLGEAVTYVAPFA